MLPIFNIFELGVKEGKKNAYVAVEKIILQNQF